MRILLVEDDPQTSEMITMTLLSQHYVVDAIADGAAGLEMAAQWGYDVILLDLLLPTLNGIEICRRLRRQGCKTPILMLTQKNSTADIVAGLDAGADDYLCKTSDASQLLARVRALLRRSGSISPSPLLTWGDLCLDPATARVTYRQTAIALRPKEYALLELFLRYPRRVLSRSAIIEHLWTVDETPVEGVVTNLIKDLRQRLKAAGMAIDLIETVYGLGYRLHEAPAKHSSPMPCSNSPTLSGDVSGEDDVNCTVAQMPSSTSLASLKIAQIRQRFHSSCQQRLCQLELAMRSLQTGTLTLEQRQITRQEIHKLAGGLGTFGEEKASVIAQAMEDLLLDSIQQESLLLERLPQLLQQLQQSLSFPSQYSGELQDDTPENSSQY